MTYRDAAQRAADRAAAFRAQAHHYRLARLATGTRGSGGDATRGRRGALLGQRTSLRTAT
jgi:hypothetical protein